MTGTVLIGLLSPDPPSIESHGYVRTCSDNVLMTCGVLSNVLVYTVCDIDIYSFVSWIVYSLILYCSSVEDDPSSIIPVVPFKSCPRSFAMATSLIILNSIPSLYRLSTN
jgi:hypothetical protein